MSKYAIGREAEHAKLIREMAEVRNQKRKENLLKMAEKKLNLYKDRDFSFVGHKAFKGAYGFTGEALASLGSIVFPFFRKTDVSDIHRTYRLTGHIMSQAIYAFNGCHWITIKPLTEYEEAYYEYGIKQYSPDDYREISSYDWDNYHNITSFEGSVVTLSSEGNPLKKSIYQLDFCERVAIEL